MSYAIHATYYFYQGTCHAPSNGCLRGADPVDAPGARLRYPVLAVATRAEADQIISTLEAPYQHAPYYLRHGEYGSPSYKVVLSSAPAMSTAQFLRELGYREY